MVTRLEAVCSALTSKGSEKVTIGMKVLGSKKRSVWAKARLQRNLWG